MPYPVKFFQSSQTGAPQLSGQAGSLIAVLNACLVNGFNLRTLTSITREGAVATATADAGHGFREGDVVLIAGASDPAYNGEQRIRAVSATRFSFDVVGEPASPASGALTARIPSLGWESPFSAVNKAAYRSRDLTGTRLFLRLDDSPLAGDANYGRGTRSALAQMWESLTDIENGTGKAETFWRKAQNESTTARPWILVGDGKRFWLAVAWSESSPNRYVLYFFGDLVSFRAADAYGCALGGYFDLGYNWSDPGANQLLDQVYAIGSSVGSTGVWIARGASQLGGRVNALWVGGVASSSSGNYTGMGVTGLPYPNPGDNGLYVMPLIAQEQGGPGLRGRVPGLFCPLHAIPATEPTPYQGFVIDGTTRTLLVVPSTANSGAARVAFDLTGPWE